MPGPAPGPGGSKDGAAVSPGASPPEPAPFAAIGVTDVRRVWTEVLTVVKEKRRTTQAMLDSATVADLDSSTLILTVPSAALGRRVMEPGNVEVLRAALREILGVDWRIRCQAPTDDHAASRPHSGATPAGSSVSGGARANPGAEQQAEHDQQAGIQRPAAASTEPEDDIPDDYGAPPDPDAPTAAPRDPEELAIELLTAQLGARRLES